MAVNDISLTSGMRNNLLQLQNTTSLINRTQERLSTGKQVNSALDNPTNFFAAQSHINRASDFAVRKDGMAEGIQTAKAADSGISAINSLVEAAKGLAAAALGTANTTDRATFATQYQQLITQINTLASDSQYRGTNLLTGDSLSVKFNETGSASLSVTGFTATASGLNIASGTNNWSSTSDITTAQGNLQSASDKLRIESKNLANNLNIITTRQDFTDNLIGTLRTGADNLTLADMNQEGANMLMLQTRNQLGTTSLSLASQAAQAILRLF